MSNANTSLGAKLIHGFLAVACITTLVGGGGYLGQSHSLADAGEIISKTKDQGRFVASSIDLARSAQVAFKKQVQEWKDLLLRGQNRADYDKYLAAFQAEEASTQDFLAKVRAQLSQQGIATEAVDQAIRDHRALGAQYREALKLYDASQPNPAAIVDRKVRGIDRAATDEIDAVVAQVHQFDLESIRLIEAAFAARVALIQRLTLAGIGIGVVAAVTLGLYLSRTLTRKVETLVSDLGSSGAALSSASSQVSSSSQSLAQGASEQAASLQQTSASIEEMSSMTRRNAENAASANAQAEAAQRAADLGAREMQAMAEAMQEIKAGSDGIAKLIKTIDEIAFQTNILALNAAVEAARAGDSGAGFAVVAEEVRNLAQRSAQAARETAERIEGAIAKTGQGVELSAKVSANLKKIVEKVHAVSALVSEVASASQEQSVGIGRLNENLHIMDQAIQGVAAQAEEGAGVSEELSAMASRLMGSVLSLRQLVGSALQAAT